jgi:hypothetical protein
MSLIRARRNRKKHWIDARKGLPMTRLLLFLVLVAVAIWYLGRL